MPSSRRTDLGAFTHSACESTRQAKYRRRLKSVPALFVVFSLTWGLLPLLITVAISFDLIRRRGLPHTRLTLFGAWWLAMELLGVITAFFLWIAFAPGGRLLNKRSQRSHSQLQSLWARSLAFGARYTIGLRWSVIGSECLVPRGPLVVLARHGSQGDALLTAALLSREGRRLRFVLKKQLLADPCLDIVGHRIPNYFVNRDSFDNRDELTNISKLAKDIGDDEALVIFPEGTRFSPTKLVNAISALDATAPSRAKSARKLNRVLPIRTAGTLSALSVTAADIVFCNHVGIQDISSFSQLRDSVPLKATLRFKLWRCSRPEVPPISKEEDFVDWLDQQWVKVDEWVSENDNSELS